MFEAGAAANIKYWVFIGSLLCLKRCRYDLRGCLQIVRGVMTLRCHALVEVGPRAWEKRYIVLALAFVFFGN